jgi:hypothetical protein
MSRMIMRQPTLLSRDIDFSVVAKLGTLVGYFPSEAVAVMIDRQPALLFMGSETLDSRVNGLIDLFCSTPHSNLDSDTTREQALCIIAMAPALISYSPDTVASTIEKWGSLIPGSNLIRVWKKVPTLLQLDVDTNIGPKVAIRARMRGLKLSFTPNVACRFEFYVTRWISLMRPPHTCSRRILRT